MLSVRLNLTYVVLATTALWTGQLFGETTDPQSNSGGISFVQHIQPVLRKYCYQCHGRDVQEGGLRLDQKEHALRGGENGSVILPGKAMDSLLLQMVSTGDSDGRVMPPPDEGSRLSKTDVELIRNWIDAGADWPEEADRTEADRTEAVSQQLWSFQPVTRPGIPVVRNSAWVHNPIDAFVLARMERADVDPAQPADAVSLARRVAFDLTGLPLTLEQLDQFQMQNEIDAEAAYARLLKSMLDSEHYGERWGRHWLDVARYADSNGYEVDGDKPLAWKYRDYVIRALNEDKPYNRFVLEQLAGDELSDASPQTIIATGFLRVGPWDAERGASVQPSEVVAERFNELDDLVRTTSQAFLGLTLGCARCHDHKFDPLSSRDYYSMVAIFDPLARQKNRRTELTRLAVPWSRLKEKNAADQRIAELREHVRELRLPLLTGIVEAGKTKLPPDAIAALNVPVGERTDAHLELLTGLADQIEQEVDAAFGDRELASAYLSHAAVDEVESTLKEIGELEARFEYPEAYFFHEPSTAPPETHLLKRGSPDQPGEVVFPAVPQAVVRQMNTEPPEFQSPDEFTTRRRIALARWITDDNNPLTPRVIVNRIWQSHFGVGLVRSPNDFGNRGTEPTHPHLLDWLAHWFVHETKWSLKNLHMLIMTSNTYRMSKQPGPSIADQDPDNLLLSYFPRRRLEVEAIRDSMLAVSGKLNRQLYGPCMYPKIPDAALRSGYDPTRVWKPFDEREASRRTVYAYLKRSLVIPFLETLDFCDTTQSAAHRSVTTVAPQALELLNGEFTVRQSEHFAARIQDEAGSELPSQIELAYRLALNRSPVPDEIDALTEFVDQETQSRLEVADVSQDGHAEQAARMQALVQMCRVIFNLNEFVYTD
ncbi:MAG: PSD1 and planctomycete cytochrome C domain-containing protein [Fuerstiella sp.]|nr:PSD1 and planctomycete cytochrome C domain-containing protein [Fuerstiella sp.]